jgi:hypothetical protein
VQLAFPISPCRRYTPYDCWFRTSPAARWHPATACSPSVSCDPVKDTLLPWRPARSRFSLAQSRNRLGRRHRQPGVFAVFEGDAVGLLPGWWVSYRPQRAGQRAWTDRAAPIGASTLPGVRKPEHRRQLLRYAPTHNQQAFIRHGRLLRPQEYFLPTSSPGPRITRPAGTTRSSAVWRAGISAGQDSPAARAKALLVAMNNAALPAVTSK